MQSLRNQTVVLSFWGNCHHSLSSRIAVHAAQDEVDAEVGDQHAQEGDDAVAVKEHGLAE